MKTQRLHRILSIIFISMLVYGTSFAQSGQTNIAISNDLEYNADLSNKAFTYVDAQFTWLINQLGAIMPTLNPVEQQQLNTAIGMITARRDRLGAIDVYLVKPASGKTFSDIVTFYQNPALGLNLEDLVQKAEDAAAEKRGETLEEVISLVPTVVLSDAAKATITPLLGNELRAYGGAKNTSRISILSAYIEPTSDPNNPAGFADPTIIPETAVVIATDAPLTP